MSGKIKIYWQKFKFFDINNKFLGILLSSDLSSDVSITETTNNSWWLFNLSFWYLGNKQPKKFDILKEAAKIEVYYMIKFSENNHIEENLIYTWYMYDIQKEVNSENIYMTYIYSSYNYILNNEIYYEVENNKRIFKKEEESEKNIYKIIEYIYNFARKNTYCVNTIPEVIEPDSLYTLEYEKTKDNWEKEIINWEVLNFFIENEKKYINIYNLDYKLKKADKIKIKKNNNTILTATIEEVISNNSILFFNKKNTLNFNDNSINTQNIKYKFSNNNLTDILKSIISIMWEKYYYFLNEKWDFFFNNYSLVSDFHTLTYGREVVKITKNENKNQIVNSIILTNGTDLYEYNDFDSIKKYWKKQIIKEDKNLKKEELEKYAKSLIIERTEEIELFCFIDKYLENFIYKKWWDLIEEWWNITENWGDLKKHIWWGSIFNIKIWDKLNVRNVDYNLEYSDLICVRKEISGNSLRIFCGNYKNYFSIIK